MSGCNSEKQIVKNESCKRIVFWHLIETNKTLPTGKSVRCLMLDMIQECASIIFIFQIGAPYVNPNNIPVYNLQHVDNIQPYPQRNCLFNNKWRVCSVIHKYAFNNFTKKIIEEKFLSYNDSRLTKILKSNFTFKAFLKSETPARRHVDPTQRMNIQSLPELHGRPPAQTYTIYRVGYLKPLFLNQMQRRDVKQNLNNALSVPRVRMRTPSGLSSPTQVNSPSNVTHNQLTLRPPYAMGVSSVQQTILDTNLSIEKFIRSLDNFERKFYKITFTKLINISPEDRQENGMSFVQSGFFLLLTLMIFSREVDPNTRDEIDQCVGFKVANVDSIAIVRHFMATLPNSSHKLKLRQSSRLVLWPGKARYPHFQDGVAAALKLQVDSFNGTETPNKIASILNEKVELDSGGAIHDTFDEDDVTGGVSSVLVTTLYMRGRWRAAPTVLNGTRLFRDADNAPKRSVRMIRINDLMKYSDLREWNAQALEISYATPGLTLLMLIPRSNSLRSLVKHVSTTSLAAISANMTTMRVAATVPIYTLRMTLLLPNKLQAMGIPGLIDASNATHASFLKLSHAVQRIMFWAEAGRNAYKDDGVDLRNTVIFCGGYWPS